MSRKNNVATRKRSKNTSSPAIQKTPEKLLDQHQHQTSHQLEAPTTVTTLGSQFPKVQQLLSEIKELKATVKNNESRISSLEQKVNSLTGEVLILNAELAIAKHVSTLFSEKLMIMINTLDNTLSLEGLNSADEDNKNLSQEIVNIGRNELMLKFQEMISAKATQ